MVRISDHEAALLEGNDDSFPFRMVLLLLTTAVFVIAAAAAVRAGALRVRGRTSATSAVQRPSDRGTA
jgi:hypothetical protein